MPHSKHLSKVSPKKKRNQDLYAYQVQYSNGAGFKPLGAFPARSRTAALRMAVDELKRKGLWGAKTKLITGAVPLNSVASKHKNISKRSFVVMTFMGGTWVSRGVFQATTANEAIRLAKMQLKDSVSYKKWKAIAQTLESELKSGKSKKSVNRKSQSKRNPYVDLVIKGIAAKTPTGWKIGRKVFPQGKGVVKVSSNYYLDKNTGTVYAKRPRVNPVKKQYVVFYKTKDRSYRVADIFAVSSGAAIAQFKKQYKSSMRDYFGGRWVAVLQKKNSVVGTVKKAGKAIAKGAGNILVSVGSALANPPSVIAKYFVGRGWRKGVLNKDTGKYEFVGNYYNERHYIEGMPKVPKPKKLKKPLRKNNDGASSRRKEFAGKVSGSKDLFFPDGTPNGLSTLGPLISIKTEKGTIAPTNGAAYLCQAGNGHLYIGATRNAPLINESGSFGKVRRVEYECAKPHLGEPKKVIWFHDFESPLPELRANEKGELRFVGGGYEVKREGIVG